ncbi:MAG: hypothetical protein FVQ79_04075 [Planctomycetes bacterium]|nr:hypothetical protein [Planctomycetota bacterium]
MTNTKEFYDKIIAGDLPDSEEIDNVFDVMDMMMKEVKSAHSVLEDLEDALGESETQAENIPDIRRLLRTPEKQRQVF